MLSSHPGPEVSYLITYLATNNMSKFVLRYANELNMMSIDYVSANGPCVYDD